MLPADRTDSDRTLVRATAGMRRVDCVRMVEGDRLRFYIEGIGHRLPVRREVSPSAARALMRDFPCRLEVAHGRSAPRSA